MAEQAAQKLITAEGRVPQALKRECVVSDLAARVELVPFPISLEREFYRCL